MATQADVRRIALALPEVEEEEGRFAFSVLAKGKRKGIAWVWLERISPKKARIPQPAVLAVRVANNGEKDLMISAEPAKFFTEPHYNGYPAVLVRLAAVTVPELRVLLKEAWACQAPPALVKASATPRTATATKTAARTRAKAAAKAPTTVAARRR